MRVTGEKGYPRLFFYPTWPWGISFLVGLLIIGGGAAFYIWYSRVGTDPAPDSIVGLAYAIIGTICLILAVVRYSAIRRLRKRSIGQLNGGLQWHVCFAVVGLALLFMHSFVNFNPRSGTYALYGMIALVISGIIGRFLDRMMPRMIAKQVNKALTAQGEDRIETISEVLQMMVPSPQQGRLGYNVALQPASAIVPLSAQQRLGYLDTGALQTGTRLPVPQSTPPPSSDGYTQHTSWDLAYISLEEVPQEEHRAPRQNPFASTRSGTLTSDAKQHILALRHVQQALQREQFLRYTIRYWRVFHVLLALVTVGLTVWHITYAMQLIIPTLLPHY
jgi:hypothetical protein